VTDGVEEFGIREAGVDYKLRPGGYVVLRSDAGEIAVIETARGLFLPGGGQDADETPERAAVREALEECGLRVRLDGFIGIADEFVLGEEGEYFRKRCAFFHAKVLGDGVEPGAEHDVIWLAPAEALARLAHGSQSWAIKRACGITTESA
jgi:8-oxo-dGTP pyrophosphatase MutT (NUDIX family)